MRPENYERKKTQTLSAVDTELGNDKTTRAIKLEVSSFDQLNSILGDIDTKITAFAQFKSANVENQTSQDEARVFFEQNDDCKSLIDFNLYKANDAVVAIIVNGNTFATRVLIKWILSEELHGQQTRVLPQNTSLVWGWNAEGACWILPGDRASVLDKFLVHKYIKGFTYEHDL